MVAFLPDPADPVGFVVMNLFADLSIVVNSEVTWGYDFLPQMACHMPGTPSFFHENSNETKRARERTESFSEFLPSTTNSSSS